MKSGSAPHNLLFSNFKSLKEYEIETEEKLSMQARESANRKSAESRYQDSDLSPIRSAYDSENKNQFSNTKVNPMNNSQSMPAIKLPQIKLSASSNLINPTRHWQLNQPLSRKTNNDSNSNIRSRSLNASNHPEHNASHKSIMLEDQPQRSKLGFDKFFKKRAKQASMISSKNNFAESSDSFRHTEEKESLGNENGIDSVAEIKPHEDVIRILRQISSSELLNPQDLVLAKRINEVQGATIQANHLLGGLNQKDALSDLDKQMLEYNDEKATNVLKDPRKSQGNIFRESNSSPSFLAKSIENSIIERSRNLADKLKNADFKSKKKYYNKWYIPVQYWGISKNTIPVDIVNDMLREDENFVYNNIHNYDLKKDPNPFVSVREKSPQQIRYEILQEKIHQNYAIHGYKKNLVETGKRIPSSLLKLDPLSRAGAT